MTYGSGLDEGMLRVANYKDHPTNPYYKVFFFYKKEQADYFASLLKENNVWAEQDEAERAGEPMYLFGIKKKDLELVHKLNNIAIGKFRQKLIPNKYGRIFIVVFGIVVIALSIIGYFKGR
ncbi:MAG: hypothetical protein ACLGGV_01950 [Bacteroidia bacterium]